MPLWLRHRNLLNMSLLLDPGACPNEVAGTGTGRTPTREEADLQQVNRCLVVRRHCMGDLQPR